MKLKLSIGLLISLLIIAFTAVTALAVISYVAIITVSNNSSTYYPMFPSITSANVSYMAAQGYIASTGNDTRVQSGSVELPRMLASDKILLADVLPNNSNQQYNFLTGQNATASFPIIAGYSGNISTLDSTNLEWSGNGSSSISGYVDTSVVGDLISKAGAKTLQTGAGSITTTLYDTGHPVGIVTNVVGSGVHTITDNFSNSTALSLTVDGVVTTSNISAQDLTTYTKTDPSGALTVVSNKVTAVNLRADVDALVRKPFWVDFFDKLNVYFAINTTDQAVLPAGAAGIGFTNAVDTSVSGFAATDLSVLTNGMGGGNIQIALVRGNGVASSTYVGAAGTYYFWLTRGAGGDIVSLKVYSDAGYTTQVSSLSVAGFGAIKWLRAFGFVNYNVADATRRWDGFVQNFDIHYSMTDNSNNWTFMTNNSMPYADNISISVNQTQQLFYKPNTIILGNTLPDRASDGVNNDGTITWGANPAGVSTTFTNFAPSSISSISAAPVNSQDVAPNIKTQKQPFSPTNPAPNNPLTILVSWLAGTNMYNVPALILWVFAALFASLMVFAITLGLFNHLGAAGMAASIVWALFVAMRVIPWEFLPISVIGFVVGLVQELR